jgi:hypothetical protein
MTDVGTRTAPVVDPLFQVAESVDEVVHLVCCRDVSWRRAFCGEENETLALSFEHVCTMCVEEAERMRPGWAHSGPVNTCPVDGPPCPAESELEDVIAERTL